MHRIGAKYYKNQKQRGFKMKTIENGIYAKFEDTIHKFESTKLRNKFIADINGDFRNNARKAFEGEYLASEQVLSHKKQMKSNGVEACECALGLTCPWCY